jgi:hypothetical protein
LPHPNGNLRHLPSVELDDKVAIDESKFTILHTGSLLGPRNPTFLLEALEQFIGSDLNKKELVQLVVIGNIVRDNNLSTMNTVSDSTATIRVIRERISYKRSKELLVSASVLLLLEAVAEDSPFMPGKLTDYIVANRPILALTPKNSETSRLLGPEYLYRTETDNVSEIRQILEQLWERWQAGSLAVENQLVLQDYVSTLHWNNEFEKAIAKCINS